MDDKTVDYTALTILIIAITALWGWFFGAWSSDYTEYLSVTSLFHKGVCGAGIFVLILFATIFVEWISGLTIRSYIKGAIYGFCAGVVLSFSSGILIFPLRWYLS